ncbi:MAG: hypothetical protein HDT44_08845 [Ruminococcaceae bacterium]|nr:hypothetical protein [Oscillospiraceae bacterium]
MDKLISIDDILFKYNRPKKRFTHLWNRVMCVDRRDICFGIVRGHVCGEVVDLLAGYEDTGLTPEEIKILQEDNARLHKLLDDLESILNIKGGDHNVS